MARNQWLGPDSIMVGLQAENQPWVPRAVSVRTPISFPGHGLWWTELPPSWPLTFPSPLPWHGPHGTSSPVLTIWVWMWNVPHILVFGTLVLQLVFGEVGGIFRRLGLNLGELSCRKDTAQSLLPASPSAAWSTAMWTDPATHYCHYETLWNSEPN